MLCNDSCRFPHGYNDGSCKVGELHEHRRCLQHTHGLDLTLHTNDQDQPILPSAEYMARVALRHGIGMSLFGEAIQDSELVGWVKDVESSS